MVSHSVVSEAEAARRPVFAIRFSRPMDPASVAAALSVKPAGAFVAPPAGASAMYGASLWGRSASAEVTIEK